MTFRHRFFYRLIRPMAAAFIRLKFGYKYEKAKNLPDNYIVLSNHVTDFDPIFVACSFRRQMYFVGSEHISRWKVFPLLNYGFAPIIRRKGTVAASTVSDILRKTRKGGSVCIFAEGVRTWDGVTCPILPSTGRLVKSAGCGLVTYRLTGGYFVSPNWSEGSGTRRGYIRGQVVNVFTKEQLAEMTNDEVNEIINRDLYENAYERQLAQPRKYKGRNLAERMENLLFICPECGGHDCFSSSGSKVTCGSCGFSFTYDCYGMLEGAPFRTVYDFSRWQNERIAEDTAAGTVYSSPDAVLSVISADDETEADRGRLTMDNEAIRCGGTEITLDEITNMDIHGRHAIVFAAGGKYYELTPCSGSNALKYLLRYRECRKNR